ncbi:hypothetical protein EDB84DRAFT_1674765 [Lactarius hengduanensis]|nr:hypothetical protein EDB84DRAFT_1674765 [Lactarius hengduanensis]
MASGCEAAAGVKHKIIQILLVFWQVSQSDVHVRNAPGIGKVVRRTCCTLLTLYNQQTETQLQGNVKSYRAVTCRLNKSRQEAAQARIIPLLMRIIESSSPSRRFTLSFCATWRAQGRASGQRDGLVMCIKLLTDHYFQHEETARVEDELAKPKSLDALLKCFVSAKAGSFENLLDPIFRHSTAIAIGIAKAQFFRRVAEKPSNSKAVVKLNLLRILRAVCDVHPNRALLVERFSIHETVAALRRKDGSMMNNPRVTSAGAGLGTGTTRGLSPSLHVGDIPWQPGVDTGRR